MGKDTTAFRERFNAYKNGKSVSEIYDAGLPRYGGGKPAYQTFIEDMGPVLFQEMVALGVKNPEAAYRNMITQLAYESNYGLSRVARELNNFGGVGWNGKTYTTYKDKADFVRNYVRLMNSRYKNVITADTLYDYAKGLKGLNYYEDSVENYTRNLTGMKSFAKALDAHIANNPDLYVLLQVSTKPMSQTTAAELNAISQFQPWLNYHQPDYPLNNPAPSSISSWNNPKSPAYTPAGLQTRRIDFGKMMMDMLEDDWEPPTIQPLKTVAPPDSKISTFTGFKNGKLPRYQTGNTPITTTGGAPVVVPVTTVPDDPGADDVKEVLERVAGFLPYIGTILDWLAVAEGNYNKVPSAIVGTVADAFLPGIKSAYKAYKAYNMLSKTAPKIVDKIMYGRKATKAGLKLSANGAYLVIGTYQDVLDDRGYMSKHKNGKLPRFKDGMKYSWDDQKLEWDRYTGDAYGDVFADFVVTPRGGAHKKDIEPLKIVSPEQEKYAAQNQPIISSDNNLYTRNRITESNKPTWRSDVADLLHGMGEGAMMAANFIPFEGELMAGAKWLGRLAKSYLKHPDYITAYHGSPYPFDIRNAWTATPYDLGLHVGRKSIAEQMAERNGVVYKLRIPPQDTETIDIGANGYKLLSNDIFKPAHPYNKYSNFGYYDSAGDNALEIRMLEQAGAKPTVVENRLYTEKDAVLPLRTTAYPDIPESELRAIDEIFRDARMKEVSGTLPENVRLDLNRRANDILSRSGYKVIKYNNTNPYEGGGGTSYMITDPSVIDVIPDKPILKPLLYPSFINSVYQLNENGYPGFKNGKSPIHIKPANRGKFTALKKRTGHSASWFKENGTPEQKKMAVFALNAKKWKH